MEKINFTNGQAPALNGANLNQLQANIEEEFEKKIRKNKSTSGLDLDTINDTCFYYCIAPVNAPISSNGYIFTQFFTSDYMLQKYTPVNKTTCYTRLKINGTWNNWADDTKNIMTIGLSANMTYCKNDSGTTSNLIPLDKVMSSSGDKLIFDATNNAIKVGAGVSKVKVSANGIQTVTLAGLCGINIAKNGQNGITLNNLINIGFSHIATTNNMIKTSLSPIEVSVTEGDIIQLTGYSDITSNVVTMTAYSGRGTNLTVEVVE